MQRRKPVTPDYEPMQVVFDPTPEIYATDAAGAFTYLLQAGGHSALVTAPYDEMRILVSLWHPSTRRVIDLDRAYVELRAQVNPTDDHWVKLAEIEPVVPAYSTGESFDGWVVLPVMAESTALSLFGSGFDPRARMQIRASAFFVP